MDLERLIHRHKNAVYKQLIRTCGNLDDAEDALADALIAALKWSSQARDPNSFQAWLAKVGTRSCARTRIRQRLIKTVSITELNASGIEMPDRTPTPDDQADLTNLRNCIHGAIELLPTTYREVYVRREVNEESAERVARDLSLTIPALKSRLHRARQLVRRALDSGLGCESDSVPLVRS